MVILRPHQSRAVEWTRDTWAALRNQGRRTSVVVQLPTGGGKTAILDAIEPDLVIAPGVDLVAQLAARIHGANVVTIQALAARLKRGQEPPQAKRVAVDEARLALAPQWMPVVQHYIATGAEVVLTDATPASADGRGLGCVAEELYQAASMKELIDAGYLVPFKVLAPDERVDALAEHPYTAWANCTPGESAIIFTETKAHATEVERTFLRAGVFAATITDDTPPRERRLMIESLSSGLLKVAICAQILRQGIDVPRVSSIILGRAIGSYPLWMQAIGRGGRPHSESGKRHCTVLDLRGAVHVHGLPEEGRTWGLDGSARYIGEALPPCVSCKQCGAWGRGGGCLICGAELPPPKPAPVKPRPLVEVMAERKVADDVKKEQLGRWVGELIGRGKNPWAARHRFAGTHKEPSGPTLDKWVREAISQARRTAA